MTRFDSTISPEPYDGDLAQGLMSPEPYDGEPLQISMSPEPGDGFEGIVQ